MTCRSMPSDGCIHGSWPCRALVQSILHHMDLRTPLHKQYGSVLAGPVTHTQVVSTTGDQHLQSAAALLRCCQALLSPVCALPVCKQHKNDSIS